MLGVLALALTVVGCAPPPNPEFEARLRAMYPREPQPNIGGQPLNVSRPGPRWREGDPEMNHFGLRTDRLNRNPNLDMAAERERTRYWVDIEARKVCRSGYTMLQEDLQANTVQRHPEFSGNVLGTYLFRCYA